MTIYADIFWLFVFGFLFSIIGETAEKIENGEHIDGE